MPIEQNFLRRVLSKSSIKNFELCSAKPYLITCRLTISPAHHQPLERLDRETIVPRGRWGLSTLLGRAIANASFPAGSRPPVSGRAGRCPKHNSRRNLFWSV